MKRNVFRTKNQLYLYRYFFIMAMMVILAVLFLLIGNMGLTASLLHLDTVSSEEAAFDSFAFSSENERIERNAQIQSAQVIGEGAPSVSLYDPENDNTMVTTQLEITKQPYTVVTSLENVEKGNQLLIVDADSLSADQVSILADLAADGMNLLFTGMPDESSLQNRQLLKLLGIESVNGKATWRGIRTSSSLLTGTMIEKTKYETSGMDVILSDDNKVYASALPDQYWLYENDDLPPIIWRHIEGSGYGRVYVFNGDFMESEMGYGIVPVVISEINENYLYPIINAYCVTASGYPYAYNEERENWERLYSRDKLLIQQDLLSSQLKRYTSVYGVRLTCFSPDYEVMSSTQDNSLTYYTQQLDSSRGLLAKEENGVFMLGGDYQGIEIVDWNPDFRFWDASTGTLYFPICFNSTTDDVQAEEYTIAGFGSTMGIFAVNIDYDNLLDYEGEDDVWTLYCSDQETMLGTQERDYGWLERVTVKEALGRILKLLEMKIEIGYFSDHIDVSVENFENEAWFILRSTCDELKIDNGTIEEIGENCYFVTLNSADAVITWENKKVESLSHS